MNRLDIGCGYPNPSEPYVKRGDVGVDLIPGYVGIQNLEPVFSILHRMGRIPSTFYLKYVKGV